MDIQDGLGEDFLDRRNIRMRNKEALIPSFLIYAK